MAPIEKTALLEGVQMSAMAIVDPGPVITWTTIARMSFPPCGMKDVNWFPYRPNQATPHIDQFYRSAPNLPVPIIFAVVYSIMQLNGAPKADLEKYRTYMFDFVRDSAK
jgi:hypothetical protein